MKDITELINKIILGDCLEVMRERIPDESIDLIYLDPPFGDNNVDKQFNIEWKNLQHYLSWIKKRLEECYRVLKSTGSIYLHCDWRTTHHLRFLMDEIFGQQNFKNTIAWSYESVNTPTKYYPRRHHDIHFYTKTDNYTFNTLIEPPRELPSKSKLRQGSFKYVTDFWFIKSVAQGFMTKKEDYIDNTRYLYPTQKPIALLKRIIRASSNEGDIVLDPFIGSGTTALAALKLNRRFIGIEINKEVVELAKRRISFDLKQTRL